MTFEKIDQFYCPCFIGFGANNIHFTSFHWIFAWKSAERKQQEFEMVVFFFQMTGFYMLLCTVAGVLTLSAISFDRWQAPCSRYQVHKDSCTQGIKYKVSRCNGSRARRKYDHFSIVTVQLHLKFETCTKRIQKCSTSLYAIFLCS